MSWKGSIMSQREEFVALAQQDGANRRALCERFGISRKTGYKWLARALASDGAWSGDVSRRPHHSPARSSEAVEEAILEVRSQHPAWGARKIAWTLSRDGVQPPAISTVHAILQRYGLVRPRAPQSKATGRFEYAEPNLIWQMDFKGKTRMVGGEYVHPLTVLDDHSRYAVCLAACADERTETVKTHITAAFHRYGLPEAFLVDNGSPWGTGGSSTRWTPLSVWLLKLGVGVLHGRPYHPQTRGKNERFNRTLTDEVLSLRLFRKIEQVQAAFDDWRALYNMHRPHEGIGMQPPVTRYRTSPRSMPARPSGPQYGTTDITRKVDRTNPHISFKGRLWRVPWAFAGEQVAVRQAPEEGTFGVFFGAQQISLIDLKTTAD